jgi:hypothetical protein
MPDKRSHRGAAPGDRELFSVEQLGVLQEATADYVMLLSKGYAAASSLKLVGDRYGLRQRQRLAVMRSGCSRQQADARKRRRARVEEPVGRSIGIDGYNVLITLESALGGGVLLRGADGCVRDLASIHGTYRRVEETAEAIELAGGMLNKWQFSGALWLLDTPVSNSGRLRALMSRIAAENGWTWSVELCINPDAELMEDRAEIIATSDSAVLDGCGAWIDLAGEIIAAAVPGADIIDMMPH